MVILLLFPILAYVVVAFFNKDLLLTMDSINFAGFSTGEVPVFLYSIFFFVLYVLFVMFVLNSSKMLKNRKIRKLEKEVFTLKSKLYDEREDELVVFMEEQKRRMEDFLKKQQEEAASMKTDTEDSIKQIILENATALEKQKADTDRILSKLNLIDEGLLSQFKKAIKSAK